MIKKNIFILLFLIVTTSCSVFKPKDECRKGDIYYNMEKYSEEFFIKEKYAKLFDSTLHESISKYFCKYNIKNLPNKSKHQKQRWDIEPLFINLNNFDGVYTKRIYYLGKKTKNPRFVCGYYHYLFIISNNEYFDLTDDSFKNKELIELRLSSSFNKDELKQIFSFTDSKIICNSFTTNPVYYIKTNEEIIFNAFELNSKN